MKIRDFESGRALNDVDIILTREEVEELAISLNRLLQNPELKSVRVSRIEGMTLAAEVSVTLDLPSSHSQTTHLHQSIQ
ncbi:hypothetical protein C0431_03610 [bacterium]|jgi:hypothetical protein|nr:hypothetical protein [bacterium]